MALNGNRAGVQLDIKTRIYGLVENGKDFPTCSLNQIANAHTDTICPKGSKVATGSIAATLGAANNFQAVGAACNPQLDVFNSGQGKLTFFFVDDACASVSRWRADDRGDRALPGHL